MREKRQEAVQEKKRKVPCRLKENCPIEHTDPLGRVFRADKAAGVMAQVPEAWLCAEVGYVDLSPRIQQHYFFTQNDVCALPITDTASICALDLLDPEAEEYILSIVLNHPGAYVPNHPFTSKLSGAISRIMNEIHPCAPAESPLQKKLHVDNSTNATSASAGLSLSSHHLAPLLLQVLQPAHSPETVELLIERTAQLHKITNKGIGKLLDELQSIPNYTADNHKHALEYLEANYRIVGSYLFSKEEYAHILSQIQSNPLSIYTTTPDTSPALRAVYQSTRKKRRRTVLSEIERLFRAKGVLLHPHEFSAFLYRTTDISPAELGYLGISPENEHKRLQAELSFQESSLEEGEIR